MEKYNLVQHSNEFVYSHLLDEVLMDPDHFRITLEERDPLERGMHIKNWHKEVWFEFYFLEPFVPGIPDANNDCIIMSYVDENNLIIWNMGCCPPQRGMGTKMLKFINQKIKDYECDLQIWGSQVHSYSAKFWRKMVERGVVAGFTMKRGFERTRV